MAMLNNQMVFLVGGWATYPSEKWWTNRQLGWFHSQLFLESHSKFHGSSHHQPDKDDKSLVGGFNPSEKY